MLPSVDFLPYFGWYVGSIFLLYCIGYLIVCVPWSGKPMQECEGRGEFDSVNDIDWDLLNITEAKTMTVHEFTRLVAKLEKGKKEVNIAQIKEVLKVANQLLDGELYKLIRKAS